jgi:DNA-binding CsgD family transcriptional regulator
MQSGIDASAASQDARRLRVELLQRLLRLVDADAAIFHDIVYAPDDGVIRVGALFAVGAPAVVEFVPSLAGTPYSLTELEVDNCPRLDQWSVAQKPEIPAAMAQMAWEPAGIHSALSLDVSDGGRLAGQIAAVRVGARPPFGAAEVRKCLPHTELFRTGLQAACSLARSSSYDCAFIARTDGAPWMTHRGEPGPIAALAALARPRIEGLMERGDRTDQFFAGRSRVTLARLTANGGEEAVLVTSTPMLGMEARAVHTMSLVRRRIAALAGAGATINEIASTLERSPHTVREHLKHIYAELGIGCRAELVRVVDGLFERASAAPDRRSS